MKRLCLFLMLSVMIFVGCDGCDNPVNPNTSSLELEVSQQGLNDVDVLFNYNLSEPVQPTALYLNVYTTNSGMTNEYSTVVNFDNTLGINTNFSMNVNNEYAVNYSYRLYPNVVDNNFGNVVH
jgi:hypothetical protein